MLQNSNSYKVYVSIFYELSQELIRPPNAVASIMTHVAHVRHAWLLIVKYIRCNKQHCQTQQKDKTLHCNNHAISDVLPTMQTLDDDYMFVPLEHRIKSTKTLNMLITS